MGMRYRMIAPSADLADLVDCYWLMDDPLRRARTGSRRLALVEEALHCQRLPPMRDDPLAPAVALILAGSGAMPIRKIGAVWSLRADPGTIVPERRRSGPEAVFAHHPLRRDFSRRAARAGQSGRSRPAGRLLRPGAFRAQLPEIHRRVSVALRVRSGRHGELLPAPRSRDGLVRQAAGDTRVMADGDCQGIGAAVGGVLPGAVTDRRFLIDNVARCRTPAGSVQDNRGRIRSDAAPIAIGAAPCPGYSSRLSP